MRKRLIILNLALVFAMVLAACAAGPQAAAPGEQAAAGAPGGELPAPRNETI